MLWLLTLNGFDCADYGILAIDGLAPRSPLHLIVSVGMFLAFDRLLATMSLLPLAVRRATRVRMQVFPQYDPPDVLLLLWNVFTALSIMLVASTARSQLSIVFKTLHVIVEACLLVSILWYHQMRGLAATAASAVLVVGFLVLVYPCDVSIQWAETAGLVLDSINFLTHLIVARGQPGNLDLRRTVRGLGLHAAYLVLYLVVNDLHRFVALEVPEGLRATLRVAGMVLNLAAVAVFVRLERSRLLPPAGVMSLAAWRTAHAGTPRALWTSPTDVCLEDAEDGELVALHRPHETAYHTDEAFPGWRRMANAARLVSGGVLSYVGLCPYTLRTPPPTPKEAERQVYVRSFAVRDALGASVAVAVGFGAWLL